MQLACQILNSNHSLTEINVNFSKLSGSYPSL